MVINDTIFNCTLDDILDEVDRQLEHPPFIKRKNSSNNIQVCCPYHNDSRPSAGIRKSDGLFHCFSGETKVITYEYGAIEMSSIEGLPVHIINGNGEWEEVTFTNYGKQHLMRITLSANNKKKIIYATPEHEWLIKGLNKKYQTQDLRVGMYLQKVIMKQLNNNVKLDPKGIVHGFCYGDGNNYGRSVRGVYYHRCYFYNESDLELLPYFREIGAKFLNGVAGNYRNYQYALFHTDRNLKEVPTINDSIEYLLGFLAGYFVADGNCFNNKITIYSHKYDDLYKIQQICTRLGIMSTEIGTSNIKAGKRGCVIVQKDTHGYTLRLVRNTIPDNFFITSKGRNSHQKYTGRNRYKVISVENTDRFENVYCCQTSTHSFALEHFILTGNCFACGEAHTLAELITHCFGRHDDIVGAFGWQWLLKNFATVSIENRKPIELNLSRGKPEVCINYIAEEELDSYRYIHPYMYKRGLTDEIIELFDIGYDNGTDCITFPIRDINGHTLFIARRSVKTKFFNYPQGVEKPLYGLYELSQYWKGEYNTDVLDKHGILHDIREYAKPYISEVIVCESMLDALAFWVAGKCAVALNGLGNELQFKQLRELPCRKLILCTDSDKAGMQARERIRQNVKNKLITEYIFPTGRKDANECLVKDGVESLQNLEEVF